MTVTPAPRLRPLGLGQLLDQVIRLYRRNFLTFIGIVAIVQIPLMLAQMLFSLLTLGSFFSQFSGEGPPADPSEIFGLAYFAGMGGAVLVGILGFLLIQGIAAAALAQAAARSYLAGRPTGIIEAYRGIGPLWGPLIGALLLAGLLGLGLLLWTLVPCVGWLSGPGMLIFFWLAVVPLIAPVIVLEKQTATGAISRAWNLTRQRFWWVLGFMVVLMIFSQLVVTGPVYVVTFLFQIIGGNPLMSDNPGSTFTLQTIVQSLVGLVFGLVYMPLQLSGVVLLYFDLRVRAEGFDMVLQAGDRDADGGEADVTALTATAPRPELTNFSMTKKEFGYFVLIALAGVALYFIVVIVFAALIFAIAAASGA